MRFLARWAFASLLIGTLSGFAAEPLAKNSMDQASSLFRQGKKSEAFAVIDKVIGAEPNNAKAHYLRGLFFMEVKQPGKAIDSFNEAISLDPETAVGYQERGEANFALGHFKDSVKDFNKVIELEPAKNPHHWQRGISCYYAKEYEEGRKQFEMHKTVNPNDVENAVWHYLCVAKISGAPKAQSLLIPM
ncbi:MAG TPA: tetratricopeptide repeat protein, partial [Candidatus Saccharimonadales bacterium]|nr:tetratricopeptide repeat protein [Candidatus Saccharimonadales bacterium]